MYGTQCSEQGFKQSLMPFEWYTMPFYYPEISGSVTIEVLMVSDRSFHYLMLFNITLELPVKEKGTL